MKTHEKNAETTNRKTVETAGEKKPYEAPALARLGNVKQLTEGIPDLSLASIVLPSL
ncbi:lasso RiPP family leader peptide-containing protein [Candidatus Sumerlaeota bacterium]|nr:lasso RiPP family leader peptide-containing protein [Candidatus Sumerlaeota bacterium]